MARDKEKRNAWYRKHRTERSEEVREKELAHGREYHNKWYSEHQASARDSFLKYMYGISLDDYELLQLAADYLKEV